MTVAPDVVMSESAPAGVAVSNGKPAPARRLSNQPIALAAAAHATLFIVGSIWMMATHDYITVIHRLYLAFLGSGVVAWVGLLAVASAVITARFLGKLALRGNAKEDRRVLGRLATA